MLLATPHICCSEPEDHWARKFDKKGVKLDVKKMKDSALVVVRCEMQVDASLGKVIAIYNDKCTPLSSALGLIDTLQRLMLGGCTAHLAIWPAVFFLDGA